VLACGRAEAIDSGFSCVLATSQHRRPTHRNLSVLLIRIVPVEVWEHPV
jgi:hypothetical protein